MLGYIGSWRRQGRGLEPLNDTTTPSIKQYRAPIKSINPVLNLFIVLTQKIWSLDDFFQGLSLFNSQGLLWAGGGVSLWSVPLFLGPV